MLLAGAYQIQIGPQITNLFLLFENRYLLSNPLLSTNSTSTAVVYEYDYTHAPLPNTGSREVTSPCQLAPTYATFIDNYIRQLP